MSLPFNPISLPPFEHNDDVHIDTAKRDEAHGVAGLDNNGSLLIQGPEIHIPLGNYEQIEIHERTSAERICKFERIGENNYILFMIESNNLIPVLTASHINKPSGIAGLSNLSRINSEQKPLTLVEYYNYEGVLGNYITTDDNVLGSVTPNPATHSFILECGLTINGYGILETKESLPYALTKSMKFRLKNHSPGVGGTQDIFVGMAKTPANNTFTDRAMILLENDGLITAVNSKSGGSDFGNTITYSDDDYYQIDVNPDGAKFYRNGILFESFDDSYLSTEDMIPFAKISNLSSGGTTGRIISIDDLIVKTYYEG